MATIARLAEILETYRGRDKIIRLASYSTLFVGGTLRNSKLNGLGESLTILSNQLNACRTVLRLFDDLSMFLHCRRYGLGSKENDTFLRITTLVNNFFMQAYYPVEHIAWARDQKMLTGKSSRLWTLGILFWLGSLCTSILQSLWLLISLHKEQKSSKSNAKAIEKQWYCAKQTQLAVTTVGSLADACNAINWLPSGFLWSGQFSRVIIGLLGSISSASLMYNYLNPVPPRNTQTLGKYS